MKGSQEKRRQRMGQEVAKKRKTNFFFNFFIEKKRLRGKERADENDRMSGLSRLGHGEWNQSFIKNRPSHTTTHIRMMM